jgi:Protein of unknown function (Hypoth_ymh)
MSRVPAGIEYVGLSGISKECQDAVLRLLQFGNKISHARILSSSRVSSSGVSSSGVHCLLLTVDSGDVIAVKSGFSSGYIGEGPRTFSNVLQVLNAFGVEIEEYDVSAEMILRVDTSSLTKADLEAIAEATPALRIWREYISERDLETKQIDILREEFPLVIPFAIVDSRIADLAISFWEGPDNQLLKGYRRLEDILRERTGIDEHGTNLISEAFRPKGGKLTWEGYGDAERAGRMQLFNGAFMAYRNRRAHRESKGSSADLLVEFLLLNHLFLLEKESTEVSSV